MRFRCFSPVAKVGVRAGLVVLPLVGAAYAQQVPDAGGLLRDQPKPPAQAPAEPVTISPAAPKEAEPADGPRILVKGFRITGAILIPEQELQAQLQPAIGKELSLGQLRGVASALSLYYLSKGYLARVFLPPQEIVDGVVEIRIIEGKRGSLKIDSDGQRVVPALVQQFIDHRLAQGEPMDVDQLGQALTIINEQPGVGVTAAMLPGQGEAEVDVTVTAVDKPLLSYDLVVSNHGAYGTGEPLASARIIAHNPTGRFDAASGYVSLSEGSRYFLADYSLAVGGSGLRLGAEVSRLNYRVTEPSLASLDARGSATTFGLKASYPVLRRQATYLSLTGGYDMSLLKDRTIAGETGDRKVQTLKLGVDGFFMSGLFGGGIVDFGADYTFGHSDQSNASALATDAVTRREQGSFGKLGYNLTWLGSLSKDWNLQASLRGQLSSKNLDSSAQMSLGGPNGVRAYPLSEASGDDALLLNLSLGRQFSDSLSAQLFYDLGHVRLNHSTWTNWNAANPSLENEYSLQGVGLGVDWRFHPAALLSVSVARAIGSNPGADINGHNVDGEGNQTRLWVNLSATF